LVHTKADTVRPPNNVIFVAQRTDKITDVWKGLVQHNFLSVPVVLKTKQKYYGFIDMYDIVKFVTEFFGEDQLKTTEDWTKMADASEEFRKKTVNDIMKYPISRRNPFFPIHSGFSVFSVIEALGKEKGLHRVPIIDRERNLITIISQSQIIQMICKNLDILGEKKNQPVNTMENYFEDVLCVHEDSSTIEAFKTMVAKEISGMAVINTEGKLVAALSLKDLKAMSTDARLFWRLHQTVKNFLLKVRKENDETGGDRPRTVVTVKSQDTLETVLKKLSEHKIHRVFIIDDNKKPLGVISLKDVVREILC